MSEYVKRIVIAVLGMAIIAALAWYGYKAFVGSDVAAQQDVVQTALQLKSLRSGGNADEALQSANSILQSSTSTDAKKARALIITYDLPYLTSGNLTDLISVIQQLKQIYNNRSLSADIRSEALADIVNTYTLSQGNGQVYDEIFSDSFMQYRATATTTAGIDTSILALYRVADILYPNYSSSLSVAATALKIIIDGDMSNKKANIALAEQYLAKSDDIIQNGDMPDQVKAASTNFPLHPFVIGYLALYKGAPYTAQYRKAYDDMFAFYAKNPDPRITPELALMHWRYARMLYAIDKDTAATEKELQQTVALAERDSQSTLPIYLKQALRRNRDAVTTLAKISPEFKAYVDGIQ